jgi:hypothetical protein
MCSRHKIAWYENDGQENFSSHSITDAAAGAYPSMPPMWTGTGIWMFLGLIYDDKIAWYENDGQQNFTNHSITTAADAAQSVYAADVDGDGDMDVLSASWNDDKIAWYENLLIITDIEAADDIAMPDSPLLYPNYPNPFNPGTTIAFALPAAGPVAIIVYDLSGRLVTTLLDQPMPAGHHEVRFNAGDLASGIYFYAIRTGTYSKTRKMVLMK